MNIRDQFDIGICDPAPHEDDLPQQPITANGGYACFDNLPAFDYRNAASVGEAIALLRTHGKEAALIAGGQDLLRRLRARVHAAAPRVLINLKTVSPRLNEIAESDQGLEIGPLATLRAIESSALVRQKAPLLAQAAHASGPVQYRNMATLGGDLCQQVHCWYYRATGNAYHCRRKGGAQCPARDGENQHHAIFGSADCVAVCASETAPALAVLGARVRIAGSGGERTVPVEDFFSADGNVLQADEMVTGVRIPWPEVHARGVFEKFTQGSIFDPTVVSVAAVVQEDGGVCRSARIALGAVSFRPWRAVHAERALVDQRLDAASAAKAAQGTVNDAWPLAGNGYKVDITRVLVRRAILALSSASR